MCYSFGGYYQHRLYKKYNPLWPDSRHPGHFLPLVQWGWGVLLLLVFHLVIPGSHVIIIPLPSLRIIHNGGGGLPPLLVLPYPPPNPLPSPPPSMHTPNPTLSGLIVMLLLDTSIDPWRVVPLAWGGLVWGDPPAKNCQVLPLWGHNCPWW